MSNGFSSAEVGGLAVLVSAGALSLASVVPILAVVRWCGPKLGDTRIMPFYVSLLVSNVLQAIGSLMNAKWVAERAVVAGRMCTLQAGFKQAGNVGLALWTFALSLHVFMLLFVRRLALSAAHCWILLVAGWFLVAFAVAVGPTAIQSAERGPYFGPTGYWCWITQNYPLERFYLEYFFEFVAAGLTFILYTANLLRVRGNLVFLSGRWHLRFVPRGERWRLAVQRDFVDGCMMRVAARMVWYPVAYTVLLVPLTILRFIEFGGTNIPFRATIVTAFVANLQGFTNLILLLVTKRFIPDTKSFSIYEPRKHISMSSPEAVGVTPFYLSGGGAPDSVDAAEKGSAAVDMREIPGSGLSRSNSTSSTSSVDSQTPFVLHIR